MVVGFVVCFVVCALGFGFWLLGLVLSHDTGLSQGPQECARKPSDFNLNRNTTYPAGCPDSAS